MPLAAESPTTWCHLFNVVYEKGMAGTRPIMRFGSSKTHHFLPLADKLKRLYWSTKVGWLGQEAIKLLEQRLVWFSLKAPELTFHENEPSISIYRETYFQWYHCHLSEIEKYCLQISFPFLARLPTFHGSIRERFIGESSPIVNITQYSIWTPTIYHPKPLQGWTVSFGLLKWLRYWFWVRRLSEVWAFGPFFL